MENIITGLTDEQMKELEEAIRQCSIKITSFAKKAFIFMLRKSENLTKPVALKFKQDNPSEEGHGTEVAFAAHSCPINAVIRRLGSPFFFFGYYSKNYGLGASLDLEYYSQEEEQLVFTFDEIEAIEI
jgi:hypothetical protein